MIKRKRKVRKDTNKEVRKFFDFNRQRFASSLVELKQIYFTLRSSKLWWASVCVLGVILTSSLVNLKILDEDKNLVLLQGEAPDKSNYSLVITDNLRFIAGKSLELFADKLPDDQISFSLTYAFTILKEGDYWILIGGTPPGSVKAGVPQDWFSPYWISIDGSAFQKLTHESMEKAFPNYPKNTEYVPGGYHWTRIGSHFFTEGRHKIEIKVMDRRKRDGKYVMYLDAIFLAPKGWKPVRSMSYLSNELFLDHAENNLNS